MNEEAIKYIKDICEHCINEGEIVASTLEEDLEDLDYEEIVNAFYDFTSNTCYYYKEILKQIC